jgi:diacylglycerol kinase family enzyme
VRARLVAEAERRAIVVAALKPGDSLRSLDLLVEATQADAVIVCGEAPVQALVASVAAARDLPCSFMPAGPDDLLARDLGIPLDDPAEALRFPLSTGERTIDVAEVNGVPFVNYVALGIEMPSNPAPRPAGRRRLDERGLPGSNAPPPRSGASPALLVANNRFELGAQELGARDWPDSGQLQIVRFHAVAADRSYASVRAAGFEEHSEVRFQLSPRLPVLADIDGEARRLAPPLRFRSVHAALRVRAPAAEEGRAPTGAVEIDQELESLRTG